MEKPRPKKRPPPLHLGGLADELKKLTKRGSAYYSETLGRYHEFTQEEEEEYWRLLDLSREEHVFDIEEVCSLVRTKITCSSTEPLSPSLKPAILKIIAAFEKTTIELRKHDPDWIYPSHLKSRQSIGLDVPIEVKEDLRQKWHAQKEDPTEDGQSSVKTAILIGITPDVPAEDAANQSTDSNAKHKDNSNLTARLAHAVDKNITSKIHNRVGPSPAKPTLVEKKLPNPMAAMASKLAFAHAKKEHALMEPKRGPLLKTRRNASDNFARLSSPLGYPPKISSPERQDLHMGSESRLEPSPLRKRSQSEVHDTRRFSFLPGDDARIATFVPIEGSTSSKNHTSETALGSLHQDVEGDDVVKGSSTFDSAASDDSTEEGDGLTIRLVRTAPTP